MNFEFDRSIELTGKEDDGPSEAFLKDTNHKLCVEINETNKYANLSFSSRLAMYEFARSIMYEAIYGEGGFMEFYPMAIEDSQLEIINGARMTLESARIFINYPD
ncbi:hypothetical protein [Neisseria sp.]|uniref:hypothetical protein n=1 Tax=Neisseria sp. TaxID=192066 RepID=UPI00289FC3F7|nr:hypothetical protein [Neisseria sp.]